MVFQVSHDSTTGFVVNEHIDHTSVSITQGTGLTGGGTIASTRTLNVVGGDGIRKVNDIQVDGSIKNNRRWCSKWFISNNIIFSWWIWLNEHIDHRSKYYGTGLTGGGTIAQEQLM